jgi:hypothetical protein
MEICNIVELIDALTADTLQFPDQLQCLEG